MISGKAAIKLERTKEVAVWQLDERSRMSATRFDACVKLDMLG